MTSDVLDQLEDSLSSPSPGNEVSDELIAILRSDSNGKKDWGRVKLSDVAEVVGRGVTPRYTEDEGLLVVNQRCIRDGRIVFHNARRHDVESKSVSAHKYLKLNDIIVNSTGVGTLGRTAFVDSMIEPMTVDTHVTIVRPSSDIDPRWLKFMVSCSENIIEDMAEGSTGQTELKREKISALEFDLPPLHIQKQIADLLSVFDEKIELLRAQNKTLESIALNVFNNMFFGNAKFAKQRLGELVDVKRGGSPRPIQDYLSEEGFRWLKISDASATASPFIFNIKQHIIKEGLSKTTYLSAGTLVLSNSATPGIPKILAIDTCIHDGWLHFPKSAFSNEFLYLLFIRIRPELIQQGSGSVFTNLKTDILKGYRAPLPDGETLKKFNLAVQPIFIKMFENNLGMQNCDKTMSSFMGKILS